MPRALLTARSSARSAVRQGLTTLPPPRGLSRPEDVPKAVWLRTFLPRIRTIFSEEDAQQPLPQPVVYSPVTPASEVDSPAAPETPSSSQSPNQKDEEEQESSTWQFGVPVSATWIKTEPEERKLTRCDFKNDDDDDEDEQKPASKRRRRANWPPRPLPPVKNELEDDYEWPTIKHEPRDEWLLPGGPIKLENVFEPERLEALPERFKNEFREEDDEQSDNQQQHGERSDTPNNTTTTTTTTTAQQPTIARRSGRVLRPSLVACEASETEQLLTGLKPLKTSSRTSLSTITTSRKRKRDQVEGLEDAPAAQEAAVLPSPPLTPAQRPRLPGDEEIRMLENLRREAIRVEDQLKREQREGRRRNRRQRRALVQSVLDKIRERAETGGLGREEIAAFLVH